MKASIAILLASLAACGDRGPARDSGVTAQEAQALNEIEAVLDKGAHETALDDLPADNETDAPGADNRAQQD